MLIPVHFLPFIFSPEFVAPIEFLMLTCLFAKNNFSGQVKPFRKLRSKLGKRTRPPCFQAMNEKLTPRGRSVLLSLLRAIFMDLVIVKHNSSVSPMTHECSSSPIEMILVMDLFLTQPSEMMMRTQFPNLLIHLALLLPRAKILW